MPKYRIEFNRETCIGALPCASAAPEYFTTDEASDGKVDIPSGLSPKKEGNMQYLEIEADNLQKALDAAQVCPVQAIHVTNLDTGEKEFPK